MELEKEEERLISEISGMTSERNNTRGSGDGANPSPTVPSSRDQTTAANMTKDTERTRTRHGGTADIQQGLPAPGGQGNNAVHTKESVCIEKQQTPDPGGQNVIYERKQGTSSPSTKVTIPTGEVTTTAQKQETTAPARQENTAADETTAAQKKETTSPRRQETMQPGVKVAYVAPMQVDLKTGTLEMLEFIKMYPTEDIDSLTKRLMAMNITSKIPEKETSKCITSFVSEMTVHTDGATGGMDKMTRLPPVQDEEVIGFDEPNTVPSLFLSSLLPKTDVLRREDGSKWLTEHYDVGLVYADEDEEMANDVKTCLKKMELRKEGSDRENCPKVIEFDELFIAKQTKLMEIIYKHCTLLFVIISENKLSLFLEELQDSSFMKSVYERKNKVVPLITQKDHNKHIPHHMSNCRVLEYYNQRKFDSHVKQMIQLYQHERLKRVQEKQTSRLG